jgi:hypothetical protein
MNIVNVMLWMKRNAYEESTIKQTAKQTAKRLRRIRREGKLKAKRYARKHSRALFCSAILLSLP